MSTFTLVKRSTLTAGVASLISLLSLLSASSSRAATISNGNFATGDYTGWSTIGDASIQTSSAFGSIPPEGQQFEALVTTATTTPQLSGFDHPSFSGINPVSTTDLETFLGLPTEDVNIPGSGSLDILSNSDVNFSKRKVIGGSAFKQTITANAGDQISFEWNFLTNELVPEPSYTDYAFFSVVPTNSSSSPILLANADPSDPSAFGLSGTPLSVSPDQTSETGFHTQFYTIPTTGTYTLGFGVAQVNPVTPFADDNTGNSAVLIDNVSLTSVPEPNPAFGILLLGVLSAGPLLKRKQRT
ncbi:MAG: hypothetical protein JO235_17655 [Chroococcidiopsidaceae cyanobacterium CP_BM_RX_35]|nr:hypothetical protein [Chroococcidiopsidaceae cyanobacterium CP_BM_RX_35]